MSFEQWMKGMTAIDERALKDIVIPGSHDCGSYIMRDSEDNISSKTQAVDISEQLKAGSRYLDLRAWRFNSDFLESPWSTYKVTKPDGTEVKPDDNWFFMYHGITWTWVSLRHDFVYYGEHNQSVVSQIRRFIEDHDQEVVVVTLEIMAGPSQKAGVWDSAGWAAVCNDLQDIAVIPIGGTQVQQKSFEAMGIPQGNVALATPKMLRAHGKRLVLLPTEKRPGTELATQIDRAGVYVGSNSPDDLVSALGRYTVPKNKMWIFHPGRLHHKS